VCAQPSTDFLVEFFYFQKSNFRGSARCNLTHMLLHGDNLFGDACALFDCDCAERLYGINGFAGD